jgi:hypothetical protein
VTFLEYEQRPEGGASGLVRALKAFAAAGVANRVVGLFDSDTAASDALLSLNKTKLPRNFRALQLPYLDTASSYPTLGPTGTSTFDVNGLACSIELYLGVDVLAGTDGELRPVQWTGYNPRLKQYQGEVLNKSEIQEQFRAKVQRTEAAGAPRLGDDWHGMKLTLELVLHAFD